MIVGGWYVSGHLGYGENPETLETVYHATNTRTLESLFEFELALPDTVRADYLGSRVYVRFEHPPEPIGLRMWQALRRLFLSQFST